MLLAPAEDSRVVTIPDTYDLFHIDETAETARDAATEVATKKPVKFNCLDHVYATNHCVPIVS